MATPTATPPPHEETSILCTIARSLGLAAPAPTPTMSNTVPQPFSTPAATPPATPAPFGIPPPPPFPPPSHTQPVFHTPTAPNTGTYSHSDPSAYFVTTPIMGDVQNQGKSNASAWTGGKPRVDWSGLASADAKVKTPNCYHPSHTGYMVKNYNLHIKLNHDKFDFVDYTRHVNKHMVSHGMDTIFYVPSIVDPTDMINVIESPDKVTLQHVIDTAAARRYMYDEYGKSNDEAAKAYLENSLSPDLKARLELKSEDDDNAATTWMRLVLLVCDSSAERFSRLKDDLKKLHPKTEPGEDISLYCDKARRICKKLHQSKQFDWSLILWIVKVFTTVSAEPFCAAWHNKRDTVDIDIQRCAHMTLAAALALCLPKATTTPKSSTLLSAVTNPSRTMGNGAPLLVSRIPNVHPRP
jgi:hypothetical protein